MLAGAFALVVVNAAASSRVFGVDFIANVTDIAAFTDVIDYSAFDRGYKTRCIFPLKCH